MKVSPLFPQHRHPVCDGTQTEGISSRFPFFFHPFKSAFTILELLVATAVMALLLVLLLHVTNHTLQASKTTTQQLDVTQSARQALDVLSSDIANAVTTDGAALLTQTTANGAPSLVFLTDGRGDTASARFLAVNYKLDGSNRLLRGYQSVGWTGSSDFLAAAITASGSATPSVLATGILQFAVLAVLEDGSMVSLLAPPGNAAGVSGSVLFEGRAVPAGWRALVPSHPPIPSPSTFANARVRALLVAIASVDEQNFERLGSAQKSLFANDASATSDPVAAWETALQASAFPGPARSAIRFHSKVIPLP